MDVCQEEEGENSIASSGASIICDHVIVVTDPVVSSAILQWPDTLPISCDACPDQLKSN